MTPPEPRSNALPIPITHWDIEKLYRIRAAGDFRLQRAILRHRKTCEILSAWMLTRGDGGPVASDRDAEWFERHSDALARAEALREAEAEGKPLPSGRAIPRRRRKQPPPGQLDPRGFRILSATGRRIEVDGCGQAEELELENFHVGMNLRGWRVTWSVPRPRLARDEELWESEAYARGRLTSVARCLAGAPPIIRIVEPPINPEGSPVVGKGSGSQDVRHPRT